MAVVTLNSRTLKNAVVAVTSDNAEPNRPHRYNQIEINICNQSVSDGVAGPRPTPVISATSNNTPPDYTAMAAWSAARIAAESDTGQWLR